MVEFEAISSVKSSALTLEVDVITPTEITCSKDDSSMFW